jgi:hypothetical protein
MRMNNGVALIFVIIAGATCSHGESLIDALHRFDTVYANLIAAGD